MKLKTAITTAAICLASISFSVSKAKQCPAKGLYVQPLGVGGPELSDGFASTSYAIWRSGKIIGLVDAGTGSSYNFEKTQQPFSDVDFILFSHFHTDHSADFPGYIKNSFFEQRKNDLWVVGPSGNRYSPSMTDFAHSMLGQKGAFPYLSRYLTDEGSFKVQTIDVNPTNNEQDIAVKDYTIHGIDAEHGVFPSLAFRLDIDGKSIVFSGDNSGQSDNLIRLSKDADVLVAHNAIPHGMHGVVKDLHMEPKRIGEIAKAAKVKKLITSHFMNRTIITKKSVEDEIKSEYGDFIFAEELACYPI